ncbi:hypothetical protein ACFHYQ_04535 [Sphaerimonospora cavernae]|uniref:Uncharacterized protein n=1 Tax=Sphaerimonospora cavernae TaxID=1740611 RepID=A0ABV6U331_9ACTN
MMKGGDWAFGCQLVDGTLGGFGTPPTAMPIRIFTPQVLAPTGARLSKTLLREQGKGVLPADVEPWMLDTTTWPGDVDNYVDALVWLAQRNQRRIRPTSQATEDEDCGWYRNWSPHGAGTTPPPAEWPGST